MIHPIPATFTFGDLRSLLHQQSPQMRAYDYAFLAQVLASTSESDKEVFRAYIGGVLNLERVTVHTLREMSIKATQVLNEQAMQGLIEDAYEMFKGYSCPTSIPEHSPLVEGSEQVWQAISKVAPRVVPEQELYHYFFRAFSTWAELEDLLYFMPRALELAVERGGVMCTSLLCSKLAGGRLFVLSQSEQDLICRLLLLWAHRLILEGSLDTDLAIHVEREITDALFSMDWGEDALHALWDPSGWRRPECLYAIARGGAMIGPRHRYGLFDDEDDERVRRWGTRRETLLALEDAFFFGELPQELEVWLNDSHRSLSALGSG